MVSIYCLIDPRNDKPFYVGATEKPKTRLSGHITRAKSTLEFAIDIKNTNGLKYFPQSRKTLIICDILDSGTRPKLVILYECSPYCVQFYETFFYLALSSQGFDLHQEIEKRYHSKKYEHPNRPKRK